GTARRQRGICAADARIGGREPGSGQNGGPASGLSRGGGQPARAPALRRGTDGAVMPRTPA
ncbi:hypothetical protein NDU88_001341, partial [Pleurodeles waltl]